MKKAILSLAIVAALLATGGIAFAKKPPLPPCSTVWEPDTQGKGKNCSCQFPDDCLVPVCAKKARKPKNCDVSPSSLQLNPLADPFVIRVNYDQKF
jgi:hypothetical protein